MPPGKDLPLEDVPETVVEAVARDLAAFSIGLLRVETTPHGPDAVLLGSGTLVSVGEQRVILTAHHVVSILPRVGRLGLVISPDVEQPTIDTLGVAYLQIARGEIDGDGPDLGAVILAPSIASTIAARKTFYNLDLRRDQILHSAPRLHDGLWFVNGFAAEKTVEGPGREGYALVKRLSG